MRNPLRTFRKRSHKPLSKNKLRRYNDNDTSNEELFEAQLALQTWFIGYMNNLEQQSHDKRIESTRLVSLGRATS